MNIKHLAQHVYDRVVQALESGTELEYRIITGEEIYNFPAGALVFIPSDKLSLEEIKAKPGLASIASLIKHEPLYITTDDWSEYVCLDDYLLKTELGDLSINVRDYADSDDDDENWNNTGKLYYMIAFPSLVLTAEPPAQASRTVVEEKTVRLPAPAFAQQPYIPFV